MAEKSYMDHGDSYRGDPDAEADRISALVRQSIEERRKPTEPSETLFEVRSDFPEGHDGLVADVVHIILNHTRWGVYIGRSEMEGSLYITVRHRRPWPE